MVEMVPTLINGAWELLLPAHRAARPHWGAWTDPTGKPHFGWEVERLRSLNRNIHAQDVVIDVGTEEGDLSGLLASWQATMVLIEPTCQSWPNAKAVWETNSLPMPLACFHGFVDYFDDPHTEIQQGSWPECANGPLIGDHGFCRPEERPDIPHIRTDTLVHRLGITPDIITMDVEGAELRVLEGAKNTLIQYVPLVYISLHPEFMQAHYGHTPAQLDAFMRDLGYHDIYLGTEHEIFYLWWHMDGRRPVELE